jgi:hypothetical protein
LNSIGIQRCPSHRRHLFKEIQTPKSYQEDETSSSLANNARLCLTELMSYDGLSSAETQIAIMYGALSIWV